MKHRMSAIIMGALVALSTTPLAAFAADFVIPSGPLQLVEFESDAPIENIRGISTDAKGTITLDLANPQVGAKATLAVPVKSLRTGNTKRDEDLHSASWLDAAAHPDLTFSLQSLKLDVAGPLATGAVTSGRLGGKLTIKGVSRDIDIAVKLAYVASSEALKKAYIQGNALRIKGSFDVVLADFGIKPPEHLLGVKVADTVSIRFALTALEK